MANTTLTERDTVTAEGRYNLSAIMTLASAKARKEAARNVAMSRPANYRRELADALRNVWTFARTTAEIARRVRAPVATGRHRAKAARIAELRTALEMTAYADSYRVAKHEARQIEKELAAAIAA